MAEAILPATSAPAQKGGRGLFAVIAWRNLWRNPRRTWLTAGGIAFGIAIVVFIMSFQAGMYDAMIDLASRFGSGHVQVQHPGYFDDPRIRNTMPGGTELTRRLAALPEVAAAAPRAEAFALVSATGESGEERSFGAQVIGVEPALEPGVSSFAKSLIAGDYLATADDVAVGAGVARNLNLAVGDEVVVLGTGREGSMAALALNVGGIFETGIPNVDRAIVMMQLAVMQDGFDLGGDVHRVVLRAASIPAAPALAAAVREELAGAGLATLEWPELMPDMEQSVRLDTLMGDVMFGVLLILVTFTIVNALVMTVFERTREFGMLLAIGMRPAGVMAMLQLEALAMWALGAAIGVGVVLAPVLYLQAFGFSLDGVAVELADSMNFPLPERLYAALDARALSLSPAVLGVATLAAAFFASLRLRSMRPVDALREDE